MKIPELAFCRHYIPLIIYDFPSLKAGETSTHHFISADLWDRNYIYLCQHWPSEPWRDSPDCPNCLHNFWMSGEAVFGESSLIFLHCIKTDERAKPLAFQPPASALVIVSSDIVEELMSHGCSLVRTSLSRLNLGRQSEICKQFPKVSCSASLMVDETVSLTGHNQSIFWLIYLKDGI